MQNPGLRSFLLVVSCAVAWGQGVSTINGTVTDPTGAVIAGARIAAVEVETRL